MNQYPRLARARLDASITIDDVDAYDISGPHGMMGAIKQFDPFQRMGIPVCKGGTLPLDNPNEHMPWEERAENE